MRLVLTELSTPHARQRTEICEHKGVGHPDTLCDGAAEAVSQALCAAYLREYGEIRHHNVDKALLVGGQSRVAFGGGQILAPIRLIVAGRGDPLAHPQAVRELAESAARAYLAQALRGPTGHFQIEAAVRTGSAGLRQSLRHDGCPLANDSSFGVGFAPYSRLEQLVLDMAGLLRADDFRQAFPAAGGDFKVMGRRVDEQISMTVALALVDREVDGVAHYYLQKARMASWLRDRLGGACEVRINTLDDPGARDENGLYLTVTGTSAEQGDDGQVGRGNRVSRLITPSRPMSLEAAAGKNPVSHVGKIYNVVAQEIARDLAGTSPGLSEVTVQMLSSIGSPVNQPELVAVAYAARMQGRGALTEKQVESMVQEHLDAIPTLPARLMGGECHLF